MSHLALPYLAGSHVPARSDEVLPVVSPVTG
jgi:hypothetical protein